ncbi:putative coiled-coil protein SlyX [Rhizobacter sp. SG703]|nr:putative coiled-coil protein SlyX [Rhizobacter sp. SG703]
MTTLLSGCGAMRLAYNQAPDLGYWWLDKYIDFNDEQTPRVRDAIASWFRWNRRTQLPDYAQWLDKLAGDLQQPVAAAQVCRWTDEVEARMFTGLDQALPALAETALSLKPEQLRHIEKRYAKVNDDYADDYLQPDPQDRLKATLKRTMERAEMLYGDLDDAQTERVKRAMAASPFDPELWLAERKARQQDVLQTLRKLLAERPPQAQAQAALRAIAERVQHSPRENFRSYQEKLTRYNCEFGAQLHNATTAAQRKFAAKKLAGWADDFRALAADGR